jgi:hypothetical protein
MHQFNTLYRFAEFEGLYKVPFHYKCRNNGRFTFTLKYPNKTLYLAFFDDDGNLVEQQPSSQLYPFAVWNMNILSFPNLQNKCLRAYIFEDPFEEWNQIPLYLIEKISFADYTSLSEIIGFFNEPTNNVPARFNHYLYIFLIQEIIPKQDITEYVTSRGETKKLSQFNSLEYKFTTELVPPCMAEILNNILCADSVKINGIDYHLKDFSYQSNQSKSTVGLVEFTVVRQSYDMKNLNII